jgi:hypothetical protein
MSQNNFEEFADKALSHARKRWCLDDEEVVREWCERRTDFDMPESLVDEMAARMGLIHSTDRAGAVRAARQLLDEYKDEFGEMRGVLLAKLS